LKALVIAIATLGLGTVVATVWAGARLAEPTVVARPYEEGLRYDEARRERGELTLSIDPDPPRAMTELQFTVRGAPAGADVTLSLAMPGMYMGENRVRLAPAADGSHRGKGTVVRCPSGERGWEATVEARSEDGTSTARRFRFEVADR
jgi:hypothetical protein